MQNIALRKRILLAFLLLAGIVSCISPLYPKDMFLQHIGTVAMMAGLLVDIRRGFLTWFSYCGIGIFIGLHILGARYVYSFVPYNEWSVSLFGFDLDATFGFTRNHYDRFVHLMFGVVIIPFLTEIFYRKGGLSFGVSLGLAWLTLQTFSMFYELFEWALTWFLSAQAAENYNGQQGDLWDAHKDMGLAMMGSTLMALWIWRRGAGKFFKVTTEKTARPER